MPTITNISSHYAIQNLHRNINSVSKSIQRLSTGISINKSADDAAGMGVSSNLRADILSTDQAIRNINDAVNVMQIADSGLSGITTMIQRLGEIATQAANGIYTDNAREMMQIEVSNLLEEITRTAVTTEFNGKRLLSHQNYGPLPDDFDLDITGPVGNDPFGTPIVDREDYQELKSDTLRLIKATIEKNFGMLGIPPSYFNNDEWVDYDDNASDGPGGYQWFAYSGVNPGEMAIIIDIADILDLDNDGIYSLSWILPFTRESILAFPSTASIMAAKSDPPPPLSGTNNMWGMYMMASFCAQLAPGIISDDPSAVLTEIDGSLDADVGVWPFPPEYIAVRGLAGMYISQTFGTDKLTEIIELTTNPAVSYVDATLSVLGDQFQNWNEFETAVDQWSKDYVNSGAYKGYESQGLGYTNLSEGPKSELILQTGIHAEDTLQTWLPWATAGSLDYLAFVDVSTEENARRSLFTIRERALPLVNIARGLIGAQQNRLEKILSNAQSHMLNLSDSLSYIRDTEFAKETASMVKNQILTQSSVAMASQANLQTQLILTLLGSIS